MAITFVREAINNGTGTGTAWTPPWTPNLGDTLVLINTNRLTANTAVSGCGATWVSAGANATSADHDLNIWIGYNCDGVSNTITTSGGGAANWALHVSEWAGVKTSSPLDQYGKTTGTATTGTTPTITPTTSGCVVIGAVDAPNGETIGSASGYTTFTQATSSGPLVASGYLIQGAAAATSTSFSLSPSVDYGAAIVSLLPAVSGGGGGGGLTLNFGTGNSGLILTDLGRSSHRPPWMSPQMRYGRRNTPGRPFAQPNLGPLGGAAAVTGTGGSAFGFSSSGVAAVTQHVAPAVTIADNDITAEDASGVVRGVIGQIGTAANPDYGIKILAPGGAATIVDGTSDVFTIVASGTMTTPLFSGAGVRTAVVSVGTGITYAPTFYAWAQRTSGVGSVNVPSITWNPATGLLIESLTVDLVTVGAAQTLTASTTSSAATEVARVYRWFILKQVAF